MTSHRTPCTIVAGLVAGLVAALVLAACGGGGGSSLVDDAEEQSEAACACTDFDCTTEYVGWFNRAGVTEEEAIEALSADDRERWDAARSAAADCQNELRE